MAYWASPNGPHSVYAQEWLPREGFHIFDEVKCLDIFLEMLQDIKANMIKPTTGKVQCMNSWGDKDNPRPRLRPGIRAKTIKGSSINYVITFGGNLVIIWPDPPLCNTVIIWPDPPLCNIVIIWTDPPKTAF